MEEAVRYVESYAQPHPKCIPITKYVIALHILFGVTNNFQRGPILTSSATLEARKGDVQLKIETYDELRIAMDPRENSRG